VYLDGAWTYFWRYSQTPTFATPENLVMRCRLRAKLDTDRRCNIQERRWHTEYVKEWGEISYRETLDPVGQRWSSN